MKTSVKLRIISSDGYCDLISYVTSKCYQAHVIRIAWLPGTKVITKRLHWKKIIINYLGSDQINHTDHQLGFGLGQLCRQFFSL